MNIDIKDSYVRQKRIAPVQVLISALEAVFGLLGVLVLILYFYTGSFAGAGQKLDAGIKAIGASVSGLLPEVKTS